MSEHVSEPFYYLLCTSFLDEINITCPRLLLSETCFEKGLGLLCLVVVKVDIETAPQFKLAVYILGLDSIFDSIDLLCDEGRDLLCRINSMALDQILHTACTDFDMALQW